MENRMTDIHPAYARFMAQQDVKFCIAGSRAYEAELDNYFGDPRSVAGARAIKESARIQGRWVPSWEGRVPTYQAYLDELSQR
jgi:hypothetical protein